MIWNYLTYYDSFYFLSDTKEASKLLERATRLLNSDPDSKLSLKDLLVGDSDSDTEQESTSKKAEETSKKEPGGKKKAGRPPATSTAASKTSTTSKTSPVSKKPVKPPTPGTRRSSRNRGKNIPENTRTMIFFHEKITKNNWNWNF